jgi:hypothetical protein
MAEGSADVVGSTSSPILGRRRARRSPLTSPQVLQGCTRAFDTMVILSLGWLTYGRRNDWRMLDDVSIIPLFVGALLGSQLFAAFDVYAERWIGETALVLPRLLGAWAATVAGVLVVMFMLKSGHSISRLWIGSWAASGGLALVASRVFVNAWVAQARHAGVLVRNVVVVGSNAHLAKRACAAMGQEAAMRIVATSLFRPGEESNDLSSLRQAMRADRVDLVVLALNVEEPPALAEEPTEEDLASGRALLAERSAEEIAAAFARLHRRRLPPPEEVFGGGDGAARTGLRRRAVLHAGPMAPPRTPSGSG